MNFINPETGVLHRYDCHAASHLVEGRSKIRYKIGETLDGRTVTGQVPQTKTGIPEGVGIGYLKTCRVCKPDTQ
jgi:hypothetical protein